MLNLGPNPGKQSLGTLIQSEADDDLLLKIESDTTSATPKAHNGRHILHHTHLAPQPMLILFISEPHKGRLVLTVGWIWCSSRLLNNCLPGLALVHRADARAVFVV